MGESMASMQPVRGTRDLLPNEFRVHKMVSDLACSIAARYGFQEVDTPIFEFTEVFARTLGDTSDIVTKEMYTFLDKNLNFLFLNKTPGNNPVSINIWKPLQIPNSKPPLFA